MKQIILFLVFLLQFVVSNHVFASDSHWTFNPYDYQYDMTVYLSASLYNTAITQLDNYEIAAFCGDECRGVASVNTIESTGHKYYYLRIRSNKTSGENILLKVYDKNKQLVTTAADTIKFVANSVSGYPSTPYLAKFGTASIGDVNEDGKLTIVDVTLFISYLKEEHPSTFCQYVADVNADGVIDIKDINNLGSKLLISK